MSRKRIYFDLFICFPDLMVEWDYHKNNTFMIYKTGKYYWKCSIGHSYFTTISERLRGRGCPTCKKYFYKLGETDLETVNPKLSKEWNYGRNVLSPVEVYFKANIMVWWTCVLGHEWEDTVNHRSVDGRGCPYCSGHRLLVGFNDFLTIHPNIALEWNYEKNLGVPSDFLKSSNSKVWWRCSMGHEWEATISNRVQGKNCRRCSNSGVSADEFLLQLVFKVLGFHTINNARILKTVFNTVRELDIYFPNENVGVEFNGWYWHCENCRPGNKLAHELKKELCEVNNIRLIVIWSDDWFRRPLKVIGDALSIIFGEDLELLEEYSYSVKAGHCCGEFEGYYSVKNLFGVGEDAYLNFAKFLISILGDEDYIEYCLGELLGIYFKQ